MLDVAVAVVDLILSAPTIPPVRGCALAVQIISSGSQDLILSV